MSKSTFRIFQLFQVADYKFSKMDYPISSYISPFSISGLLIHLSTSFNFLEILRNSGLFLWTQVFYPYISLETHLSLNPSFIYLEKTFTKYPQSALCCAWPWGSLSKWSKHCPCSWGVPKLWTGQALWGQNSCLIHLSIYYSTYVAVLESYLI